MVTREQRGIGHLLVLPTAHRETILDLTHEATQIMTAVMACSRAILDTCYCPAGPMTVASDT